MCNVVVAHQDGDMHLQKMFRFLLNVAMVNQDGSVCIVTFLTDWLSGNVFSFETFMVSV